MDFKPVTDYIESFLRREKGVPSCDIQIMRSHETLLRYRSGVSDHEAKTPVTGDELYYMYSCTKPVTCAAAMQLVERGIISLDDPVSKYLPPFKDAFLLRDGKKVALKRTMTVRHLFTMSAGFDYNKNTDPIRAVIAADPHAPTLDIINALVRSPLRFEPGEKFMYSLCHDVLAAVVEVASGMKFSQYLQENILDPLGMHDTSFRMDDAKKQRLAAQYEYTDAESLHPFPPENEYRITDGYESGGAGLISTVDDYSLFADAMACGGVGSSGARILKPETIDLMRTEQLSTCTLDPTFVCSGGPGYGYALGVRTLVDKSQGQRSPLGEFGWDGAAGSYVMMDPANELSIFFAMHVRGWPDLIGYGHAPIRDLTYEVLGL